MRLILIFLFIQVGNLYAQQVDYNTIILPKEVKNVSLKERLVQLAWANHPSNRVIENEVSIARNNINVAKSSWLGLITLTGNLNEFNINPDAFPGNNNFYPRYNVGLTIPLSIFMETPNEVKAARKELIISEEKLNEQKLALRAEVLSRYETYLEAKQLLEIQRINRLNEENYFELVKQKFIEEQVSIEDYNDSFAKLNEAKAKEIQLKTAYNKAVIQIEELIGFPLDNILPNQ